MTCIDPILWPAAELGDALAVLLRVSGLAPDPGALPPAPADASGAMVERWLDAAAGTLGLEAEPVDASHADAASMLAGCAPALVRVPSADGVPRFAVLVRGGGRRARVVGPDRRASSIPIEPLRAAVCAGMEAGAAADVRRVLDRAGVPVRRRAKAEAALLRERLGARRVGGVWMLRPRPGAPLGAWAADGGVRGLPWRLGAVHVAQHALWVAAWALLGAGALTGRVDGGRLLGWALALMTAVPLRALSAWWQGVLGVRAGAALKRRLLDGALRLRADEVRHQGAGRFLGTVIESEAMESLALSGGIAAALGALELAAAFAVLAAGSGWTMALTLAAWCAVVLALAARYHRLRRRWTQARLEMTHALVERMVGYRTRLAQEDASQRHAGEDEQLGRYLPLSAAMDRAAARLPGLAARGWLLVGWMGILPAWVRGGGTAGVAAALGGVLLAWQSLARLGPALLQLPDAGIAWARVGPLFRAAARAEPAGAWEARGEDSGDDGGAVLEATEIVFQHEGRGAPVLDGVSLRIERGDRVLLEGPSGAGKSTLAAVLAGLRQPDAGSLLLGGLDRWTVGAAEWRRRVAAAPQFHENHVLTGTLAFNLLMGRRWPAPQADLDAAEALCRELGLGPLLDRMPAGIQQMMGEGGWQLSHGERGRVFLARALLQGGHALVLDESFAALDPHTLAACLEVAVRHAPALVVIAHP